MRIDTESCDRARQARDPRFDGRFFIAVKTTGIYCRPVCPVRIPLLRNVRFLPTAAACEAEGFRPCKRCRPETAPGTPAWNGASAVVSRALRVIQEDPGADLRVDVLASRLGIGERQLRRLFADHVGASPAAVARTARAHLARRLIDQTDLPMAQVALASGFGSVRQFNEGIRERFGDTPRALRQRARRNVGEGDRRLCLRLPYRPPFAFETLLGFLAPRALPGIERVGANRYTRILATSDGPVRLDVTDRPEARCLELSLTGGGAAELLPTTRAVRRLFDLDADPVRIQSDLRRDPFLRERIEAAPGLRLPGAFDPFESLVRIVLGQQVSVKGATTLAGRLIEAFGKPLDPSGDPALRSAFPSPERLSEADLATIGIPESRAEALRQAARATAAGALDWSGATPAEAVLERLRALPGIGEWTAQVVAMRALSEPDAFPAGDLGIRKALANGSERLPSERVVLERAEAWRPWRAYAALWLWQDPEVARPRRAKPKPGPAPRPRTRSRAPRRRT